MKINIPDHMIRFGNMFPTEEQMERPYLIDTEPFKIVDGLYYVGNLWCSSHLIDTGDGLALLDVPTGSGYPGLLYNIQKLGYRVEDIRYILISHAHADHFGCAMALKYRTGATIYMGRVDTEDMRAHAARTERKLKVGKSAYNEEVVPDVLLDDGDVIELGDLKIRWVLTPGHTVGVMSHFWDMKVEGRTLHVGIYGGAGFGALSEEGLKQAEMPKEMQTEFLVSVDKVWEEPVDLMLGNHPFHSDIYQKHVREMRGEKDPFIDPEEWQRFLTEIRTDYTIFRELTGDEIHELFRETRLMEYYGDCLDELMIRH